MEEKKEETSNVVPVESPTGTTKQLSISPSTQKSFNSLNLFDEKQLVAAENFLTKVMRSDKGGIKSVNDGLAVLMRAQDLNLPFSTCIEHIHVINGKTGVDIHIVKALLSRAGCTWRCVRNYQPLYEYTDGINVYYEDKLPDFCIKVKSRKEAEEKSKDGDKDSVYVYPVHFYKDFNGNIYRDYQLNQQKFGVISNRAEATAVNSSGKTPVFRIPAVQYDYITEYEITRVINGKEVKATGTFTQSEALTAGMFEKDTYKKYPKVLIGHRAFTYAAREIASDILFGVMETTELKIVTDTNLDADDFVEVEEIQ